MKKVDFAHLCFLAATPLLASCASMQVEDKHQEAVNPMIRRNFSELLPIPFPCSLRQLAS